MNYHEAIAKNTKKYCKRQKMSYSQLARKANIPISTLQKILYTAAKDPRISTVHAIARALKVKVDNLLK